MKSLKQIIILFIITLALPCQSQNKLDIQGHRGARGVFPENSIAGFLYAVETGVTTIELDVVISKDNKVVVSHEPWMSATICLHPTGKAIKDKEEMTLNLYKLNYGEIAKYDCGSRGNERFPEQKKIKTAKPLLSEAIRAIEEFISIHDHPKIQYNIEIKSVDGQDDEFHPEPRAFAELVYQVIEETDVLDRVVIQSFDFRSLRAMRSIDRSITLAVLIGNNKGFKANLEILDISVEIYSPNFKLVDQVLVEQVHKKGMKIIPWTVNEQTDMKRLIGLGVDGIITDFPERCIALADTK